MSPDFWAIITTGIAILIAIAASNRSLRREMSKRIDRLSERIDRLSEGLGDVRERLGRVEGLLEGFGLTRWKRMGRDDEKHGSALPPS